MNMTQGLIGAVLFSFLGNAFCFGNKGHETVGAVADQILADTPAGKKVSALLNGETLEEVSTWADVIKNGDTDDAEFNKFRRTHMRNDRSWNHTSYHYTNLPIQETSYDPNSVGAAPYDIVQCIKNCVLILQGKPAKDPFFAGVTPHVATILLAHYIGDLHQPLHVGALYLTEAGKPINPNEAHGTKYFVTRGGNFLLLPSASGTYDDDRQLHKYWDSTVVDKAMKAADCGTPAAFATFLRDRAGIVTTPYGDPVRWPEKWVRATLPIAAKAHESLSILGRSEKYEDSWEVAPLPSTYQPWAVSAIEDQITLAGIHLAQLLKAALSDQPLASSATQPAATRIAAAPSASPSPAPHQVVTSVGLVGFFAGEPQKSTQSFVEVDSVRISPTLRRYTIRAEEVSADDYYANINPARGNLKKQLYQRIKGHREFPYTSSARPDVWDALIKIDEDPQHPGYVHTLYSDEVIAADEHGDSRRNDHWNREHVWAKSRGDFGTSAGAGTDLHHLRAEDQSVNSTRNNRHFDVGGSTVKDKDGTIVRSTQNRVGSGYTFEPRDEVKGDIARMIFYMAVRYEGDGDEPDLEINDTISGNENTDPFHGVLSTLREWHENDPVSEGELARNEKVFEWQGNRNPFIDHPEWVELIWN